MSIVWSRPDRRAARRLCPIAAFVFLAVGAPAPAQLTPGGHGKYGWVYYGTPGNAGDSATVYGNKLFFHALRGFGVGGGPRTTIGSFAASGRVDVTARKLGARVDVFAQLVPFDPDAPPGTLPPLGFMDADAEAVLIDEVTLLVPDLPLGADVTFSVQPTLLTGEMLVPDFDEQAVGTASLTMSFNVLSVDGGDAPQYKVFTRHVPEGISSSWDADESTKINWRDPIVRVKNGRAYTYRFDLQVAAGITPDPSNPKNPRLSQSYSRFQRTVAWAGMGDFADASGRPLSNVTVTSSIGFDWKSVRTAPLPPEVVEYYNASLDHYFITPLAAEQDHLDAGKTPTAWVRTGESFGYHAAPAAGTSPVCRFYIPPALGDSHFFGRGSAECDATAAKNPSFTLEAAAFIHTTLPTAGNCPDGTDPVYRVFSNRRDANHRYTTSRAIRDQMVAKGWLAEGDGPDLVVMCAPK